MTALAQAVGARGSRILGLGAARGDLVVSNDDIAGPIDSSDEWIQQRTGVRTRRRARHDVEAVDLAEAASREAIERAGIRADRLGAVLVSTISNVAVTPSLAADLADRVGATPAPAWDISAACAGYTYAIAQADALIRAGAAEYVLVVGAEKLSQFARPTDRSISFLLADGAGAAVLGPTDDPGVSASVWGSDGSKWALVGMEGTFTQFHDGEIGWPLMRQDGPSVYRWAVYEMVKVARKTLEVAGVLPEQLAAFVPHQANMRIVSQLAKELGLPDSVIVADDITTTGNTSAASIPLATHRLLHEHPELSGGLSLQIGFGAGLVFGAQVVRLP